MTSANRKQVMSRAALALGLAAVTWAPAAAETPAEFYKGKNVTLLVGASPGGGYATYADLLSRHYGRHIPGKPHVIAKSTPGAGGLKATQLLYNASPKDGSVFAAVFMGSIMEPLLGDKPQEFDATKLIYIGSLNQENSICLAWHTSPVKTFNDLQQHELVVGASGWTSSIRQFPVVLANILGAKFRVIAGYDGSATARFAMEKGETNGICGLQWSSFKTSHKDWLDQGKVRILAQLSLEPHPELKAMGVPMIWDFVKNEKDAEALRLMFGQLTFGRPYILPPGVPADRVAALRKAFMDTTKDSKFLEDAKRSKLGIEPVDGETVQKVVAKLYQTDPAAAARVKQALAKPKK